MQNMLRSNKGFLLITSYLIMMVLLILGAAFFAKSINENANAQITLHTLAARYAAEKGLECAYYEIKAYAARGLWVTHTVNAATKLLEPVSSVPNNFIILSAYNRISPSTGCYEETANTSFQVKTYVDPNEPNLVVMLSKGISRGPLGNIVVERLFITKVSARTPYDYFIYSPDNYWMHRKLYYSFPLNKVQINGDIILGDYSNFISDGGNMGSININTAKDFRYYVQPYVPPGRDKDFWYLRSPWYVPNTDEQQFISPIDYRYINQPDGHVAGDRYGVYRTVKNYTSPNSPYEILSKDITNPNPPLPHARFEKKIGEEYPNIYRCVDGVNCNYSWQYLNKQLQINWRAPLPNRLDGYYYWNKYTGAPTVGKPGPDDILVNYINTSQPEQAGAWNSYLQQNGLSGVLNKGVAPVRPPSIPTQKYLKAAQNQGIYLYVNSQNNKLTAQINGATYEESGGTITVNGTPIIQKKAFMNARSGRQNEVAILDVAAMQGAGATPNNRIIYSKYGIALKNAAENLPNGGLTTVGEENIILQGHMNKNCQYWTPLAVIGAKQIYTVSASFDYPTALPVTLHNVNYPYVPDDPNYYSNNEANMPHAVPPNDAYNYSESNNDHFFIYDIAIVSHQEPEILERWMYPAVQGKAHLWRWLKGPQTRLSAGQFPYSGILDVDEPGPNRNRQYPGWPWDMTAILGDAYNDIHNGNFIMSDQDFLIEAGMTRVPGYMLDDSQYIWLELASTAANFNYRCDKVVYQ